MQVAWLPGRALVTIFSEAARFSTLFVSYNVCVVQWGGHLTLSLTLALPLTLTLTVQTHTLCQAARSIAKLVII